MNLINRVKKKITKKNKKKINFSFELFPPSKLLFEKKFFSFIKKINKLNPTFISITHGANNGNRNNTYNFIKIIRKIVDVELVPHMTCINNTRHSLKKNAKMYCTEKINHIIALRGDNFKKNTIYKMYAIDLIILLKKISNFFISVAAYPEVHPEAKSAQFDLLHLKKKFDYGANQAITQFFFDIENFLRFRDKCFGIGIKKKIIPGILPIYDFNQVYKFCLLSNIYIPNWLKNLYIKYNYNSIHQNKSIGLDLAVNMIESLYKEGIHDFHIYTLNKLDFSYSICKNINL
ncbi:MAG: 5,10-methylenetetrahydrofolate reductase [Buchnera aphidicola (Periphyllus acericola)]|uniref:methylenetetrahydrofolate reductase n=1 Tax=Buchnera aphidicola TaxID=9 RepID=UPI0030CB68E9|nr:5,10-methylenetetrahydrofolate reductase [Buchnera aphidicola (Periphyllus acericola)]